jgi:hypothetical protein
MLIVSIFQTKDTDWWIGLKNKIQPFVAYKNLTSLVKKHIGLK